MFILYNYNNSGFYRLVELKNTTSLAKSQQKKQPNTSTDNMYYNNISRSKKSVKELALCNDFNYFVTITIKNDYNRFNIDNAFFFLQKFCKKYKRKFSSFSYVFIAEYHKNGAIHFHGLCSVPFNAIDFDLYPRTIRNQKNNKFYHCFSSFIFDDFGRNTFQPISSKEKISSYILKYITKDCIRTSTHRLYMCSRGLKHADKTYYNNEKLNEIYNNKKFFENDFYRIIDFHADELTQSQKLEILNSIETSPYDLAKDYEAILFYKKLKDFYNNTWFFLFFVVLFFQVLKLYKFDYLSFLSGGFPYFNLQKKI